MKSTTKKKAVFKDLRQVWIVLQWLREIPVSMLIKLADLYKTSVDYILNRTDKV